METAVSTLALMQRKQIRKEQSRAGCHPTRMPFSNPHCHLHGMLLVASSHSAVEVAAARHPVTRAVGCTHQDKMKDHQSLSQSVTEVVSKEDTVTQLCLIAVMCFLIPSNLALSISQPYDTTGETLS